MTNLNIYSMLINFPTCLHPHAMDIFYLFNLFICTENFSPLNCCYKK